MVSSFVLAPLTVLTGGQSLERVTNWGGFVMVIRPLRVGLEGFFEKNGKKLPVAALGLEVAKSKGVCSVKLFLFLCVRLFELAESHWHNMPMTLFRR
jgi:hypothetical protein